MTTDHSLLICLVGLLVYCAVLEILHYYFIVCVIIIMLDLNATTSPTIWYNLYPRYWAGCTNINFIKKCMYILKCVNNKKNVWPMSFKANWINISICHMRKVNDIFLYKVVQLVVIIIHVKIVLRLA